MSNLNRMLKIKNQSLSERKKCIMSVFNLYIAGFFIVYCTQLIFFFSDKYGHGCPCSSVDSA